MDSAANAPRKYLEVFLQVLLFAALGVASTYWLTEDVVASAIIGLGAYFVSLVFLMISDVVHIRRELAEFRNGDKPD